MDSRVLKALARLESQVSAEGMASSVCPEHRTSIEMWEALVAETWQLKRRADVSDDRRTSLDCLRILCSLMAFREKLKGEFDKENQANCLNVVSEDEALKIAETFVSRHKPKGDSK